MIESDQPHTTDWKQKTALVSDYLSRMAQLRRHFVTAVASSHSIYLEESLGPAAVVAVALGGKSQILPLVRAIVPGIGRQRAVLLSIFRGGIPRVQRRNSHRGHISIRAKGLEPTVRGKLLNACRTHCAQHLAENMVKSFQPGDCYDLKTSRHSY